MKSEYKKYGIGAIVISLTILSLLYMMTNKNGEYEITISDRGEESEQEETWEEVEAVEEPELLETIEVVENIPIYICGQVNNPDVYYLEETTIIKDAIIAAGGFTEDADKEVWNLAMEVQKGEKIYVPKVGEEIDKTSNSYDNRESEAQPTRKSIDELSNTGSGLININTANAQQLGTLPGIGPTIAQNIIDYRDANGEFKNLQDVTNVSRIGVKTLEKIKNTICFQ